MLFVSGAFVLSSATASLCVWFLLCCVCFVLVELLFVLGLHCVCGCCVWLLFVLFCLGLFCLFLFAVLDFVCVLDLLLIVLFVLLCYCLCLFLVFGMF